MDLNLNEIDIQFFDESDVIGCTYDCGGLHLYFFNDVHYLCYKITVENLVIHNNDTDNIKRIKSLGIRHFFEKDQDPFNLKLD